MLPKDGQIPLNVQGCDVLRGMDPGRLYAPAEVRGVPLHGTGGAVPDPAAQDEGLDDLQQGEHLLFGVLLDGGKWLKGLSCLGWWRRGDSNP